MSTRDRGFRVGRFLVLLAGLVAVAGPARAGAAAGVDALGDPLPPGAVRRIGTARLHEGQGVRSLSISPDGKTLATSGEDAIHLWQVPGGKLLATIPAQKPVVAYGPDGHTLAVIGPYLPRPGPTTGPATPDAARWNGSLRLFDTATGRESAFLAQEGVNCIAFNGDGSRLLAGDSLGKLTIYDTRTGRVVLVLQGADVRSRMGAIARVAFSADGATAAAVFGDRLYVWDVTARKVRLATVPLMGGCVAVHFTPDGHKLLTLHDPRPGDLRKQMAAVAEPGADCIRTWDVSPAKAIDVPESAVGKSDGYARVPPVGVFSPDGSHYAFKSGGDFNTPVVMNYELYLADVAGGHAAAIGIKTPDVTAISFSADGRLLATGRRDGMVNLWEVATAKPPLGAPPACSGAECVAVSPDGRTLAVGSDDGVIRLYGPDAAKPPEEMPGHQNAVVGLGFSPDERVIASVSSDHTIGIWGLGARQRTVTMRFDGLAQRASVAWTADSRYVGVTVDHAFGLWDPVQSRRIDMPQFTTAGVKDDEPPAALELAGRLQFHAPLDFAQFDVTYGGVGKLLGIHPQQNPDPFKPGPLGQWSCATISPDRKRIAIATVTTLRLFDAATLHELARLWPRMELDRNVPMKWFRHVLFTPDGARLVTVQDQMSWAGFQGYGDPGMYGGPNELVRVWDVASGRELSQFATGHTGAIQGVALTPTNHLLTASRDGTVVEWDLGAKAIAAAPDANAGTSHADAAALWKTIETADAEHASNAVMALSARPADAVAAADAFLHGQPESPDLAALLRRLGSADFAAHLDAIRVLAQLRSYRPDVEPMLVRELLKADLAPEMRTDLKDIWSGMGDEETPEFRLLNRAIRLLELTGKPEARRLLEQLAAALPAGRGGDLAAAALARMQGSATTRPAGL